MRRSRPILWLPMALPIGVSSGFISVSLANALTRNGVSESATGDVIAAFFLATSCGVLFGPPIDAALSRRLWIMLGTILTAVSLMLMTVLPLRLASTASLTALAFASGTGAIVVGLASKGFAAHTLPMEQRALAGAWYAAGNLGGYSVAGATGVWLLASGYSRPLIAAVVGGTVLLTLIAVALLPPDQYKPAGAISPGLKSSFADAWQMLCGAKGSIALLLCIVPFGTGAAASLMPSMAPQWHAGPGTVSFATALSAPVSAVAALAGGWFAVRVGAWRSYLALGTALSAAAIAAMPLPHTPTYFFCIYSAYSLLQGAIWTGFYAVVFDTAGQGAASTKMGVYLSLANLPFWYMVLIESRVVERWGISGLLLSDAAAGLVGLAAVIWLARHVELQPWRTSRRLVAPTMSTSTNR